MSDGATPSANLADTLEPSRLREELTGEPSSPATVVGPSPEPDVVAMQFTGNGREYFRIWSVNLLLTIATLGIYSAWAKVRKTRYFWQNTRLAGHAFDYHASAWAILRGRIIALVLLAAYSWAFEFSTTAGLVTIGALFVVGPWLFLKAQRFKLGNSSHRGLRFVFDSTPAQAYRVVMPILALWFSTTLITALAISRTWMIAVTTIATLLGIPWMHHRLKAYQHERAAYGDRHFSFERSLAKFYWVYAKGFAIVVIGGIAAALLTVPVSWLAGETRDAAGGVLVVVPLLYALAIYVFAWPYLAARLQQVVWSATRMGDVRFATLIEPRPLRRLVIKNVALTVISAGLYWPFAAIAFARYRVECMRVSAAMPFAEIAATTQRNSSAVGDASAEVFGLDIGL